MSRSEENHDEEEDGLLDDGRELLLAAGREVHTRTSRIWHGFSDFALQDNVLEVAVGLM